MHSHPLKLSEVLTFRAGPVARALIAANGLQAADVGGVPAAAGGPKGLALHRLDCLLFGDWLRSPATGGARRVYAGASIGAWRLAAAAQRDPVAALARLAEAYCSQRYPEEPPPGLVSAECRRIVTQLLGLEPAWCDDVHLCVVTSRGRGLLRERCSSARFAAAALANFGARRRLARHLERVVFSRGGAPREAFDEFGWVDVRMDDANTADALLASGTLPLVADPVRDIAGSPRGPYWDGGLIDYHLFWPWHEVQGLVLYPHFTDRIIPGWLDKLLPWRRGRGEWLGNVLLVAPTRAFLATLPNGKLPDRSDFHRYGQDHDARIADWKRAIGECGRLADAFLDFCSRPEPARLLPI